MALALRTNQEHAQQEIVVERLDGSRRIALAYASPFLDESDTVVGAVNVLVDITTQKRTEQELAEQSERLREVAAASAMIHSATATEDVLQITTEEARRIIGTHQAVSSLTVNQQWAQAVNARSFSPKYAQWQSYDAKPDGTGIYSLVCRTNRPMRLTQAELEAHPAFRKFGTEAGSHPPLRGWLAVPFVGRDGRNLGLIQVSDKLDGTDFTADDEAILVQLATIASVALENARLYDGLRQSEARLLQDITERKQAEEALRQATEQLRIVTDSMAAPVTRCSRDLTYLWLSKPYADWINRPADEILGRPIHEIIGPEAFAQLHPKFEKVLAGHVVRYEEEVHFQSIGPRWINAVYTPTLDAQGVPDGWVAVVIDVTERKRLEESLRQRAEEIEKLMDMLPLGVFIAHDPACQRITGNRAGYEMLRLPVGSNLSVTPPAGEEPPFTARHNGKPLSPEELPIQYAAAHAVEVRDVEVEHVYPDGTTLTLFGSASPLFDRNGNVRGCVASFLDITARKQAEEALREASATLRSFYDTAPVMMGVVEVSEDDILHLTDNAATGRFFGVNPERLARHWASELGVPHEHLREWVRHYRESERTGQPVRFEYPHETPGGTRWVSAIVYCMERLPGGRSRCSYVAEDVTERKQVEEALRQSEQRFARFMHHLPGLAWIKDLQGRYVYANDAAVKVFGCTQDRLLGRTDGDVFPPQTAAQFKANDCKALASETGVQIIETLEHEGGIVHHSVVSKFPILGMEGSPAFVGGMAIDITDRLRAEKVLAESEERFRQLAENINEVFWMTDPQTTKLLYISPAYERVWGRSCQSLYENVRSFLDAVHPEDRERVRIDVLERQRQGEQIDKEYRIIRPDGSIRWVRDRAFPVKDAAGRFYRLVGIIDDFTERKYAEEALKEANRRKDEFLATLAHELRNPLAPIRNAVELMRRANGDATLMEKARAMLERQIGQMVRLVDDLLDISRITRGKLQLRQERVELAAIVLSAVESVHPVIDAQAHDLAVTLPQEPVHLEADPIRLAQVISNLLNNAAKFTDRGGHIWLAAERRGGEVVVSVRDTGIGIAAEHLPHVFEMFSQAAPALERSQGGLGIGLALVRGLVELHGGTVEGRSAGPGTGSEFTVRLPVAEVFMQPRMEPSRDGEKCQGGPKCRILVVDDLRDSVDSLALMLRLAGHDIQTAHDGLEAVQAAATFRPDVVLLDIGMPKMNGYEAARHIRQQPWGKDMLLVALTGWGQEEDKRRTVESGFDHHLTKPVDPAALEKLLSELRPKTG